MGHSWTRTFSPYKMTYALGLGVSFLIIACYALPLSALFSRASPDFWASFAPDSPLKPILFFSLWQAFLSAILAVSCGLILARAFFYQSFMGKKWAERLFSLTFVLPSMVVIFALMGIYGQAGWLNQGLKGLGFEAERGIYGLTGILIAHLFFNLPLASRLFLQSYRTIPPEQHQLAAQLGIRGKDFIRLVEWAYLRPQILPTFSLIFMLCFSSFAVVLALGGSPKYTTLEVGIYQSLFFDFNLSQAGNYALWQFLCCFLLFALSAFFAPTEKIRPTYREIWLKPQSLPVRIGQIGVILLAGIFLFTPLFYILTASLNVPFIPSLKNPELWQALGFSLIIAPLASLLSLFFALALLYFARLIDAQGYRRFAEGWLNMGMLVLAVPTMVLALGLFLLFQDQSDNTVLICALVVLCNALMCLPFVIKILTQPLYHNMACYHKLCLSLNIKGLARFRLIEWQSLKRPIRYAFALALCLSLGDFTAIALFGNPNFTSLPQLLYQQLSRYQMAEAGLTAGILLLLCGSIFYVVEKNDPS